MMAWKGILVGIVVALALLLAATVPAHTARYPSRVTIHALDTANWRGRVFSDLDRCERNRLVKIFHAPDDAFITETRTDADGHYRAFVAGNSYYAKVTRKVLDSAGHHHLCGADRSPTVEAPA